MRVISGKARGTILRPPSGEETRPITDRAKDALFNIIQLLISNCRFLDLFAGTGGVGIEALSRGAKHATFIELSKRIYEDLTWNIQRTRLQDRATTLNMDAFRFLEEYKGEAFDIIFVAPPQWVDMCQSAIDSLCKRIQLLNPDGIIITQHDPSEIVTIDAKTLVEYDRRIYAGVQFNFYKRTTSL